MLVRVHSLVLLALALACTASEPKGEAPPPNDAKQREAAADANAETPDATIIMTAEGCKLGEQAFVPCAALCERVEAGELAGADFVELFSAEAKPDDLSLVIGCLTSKGVTKIGTRAF